MRLPKFKSRKKNKLPPTTPMVEVLETRLLLASINLSTGLDSGGNLISVGGTLDANWTVDQLTGGPTPAQITTPSNPVWYTGTPWLANGVYGSDPASDWITRDANNVHQGQDTPYNYYRFFVLSASDLATATMSGGWTIDDIGTLSLNGHSLGTTGIDQWTHLTDFSVPAGSPDFVVGLNELTITMTFADDYIEGARLAGTLSGITGGEVAPAPGPVLYWDPGHISAGSGSGGTGVWNSLDNNWYSASANAESLYVSDSTAIFGSPAGTVSVAGNVDTSGLTFNADGYAVTGGTLTLLNGNVVDVTTGTTTIDSVLAGADGLDSTGPGTLILTGANTYTGPTVVSNGTLSFEPTGTALDSSSFTVDPSTVFILQTNSGDLSNRLGSSASITLDSSVLEYYIAPSGNSSESIGALNLGTGLSNYVTDPGANSVTSFTVASLDPAAGATFNLNAGSLSGNAFPASHVIITAAPSGQLGGGSAPANDVFSQSIIPYIAWDGGNTVQGTYAGWVSYQGGQLRPLIDGTNGELEYNPNITSGAVTQDNVQLNNSQAVNAATTINSLILNASGGDISGSGAITVSSGALMYERNATMANAIIFPNGVPGYLYVSGASTAPTIASAFAGNTGITITGENTTSPITLTGNSTYTGTTFINNALIVNSASSNFGDSNSIVLNDNGVLAPTAGGFLSSAQSLTLNPGSSINAPGLTTPVDNLTFNPGGPGVSLDYTTQLQAAGAVQLNGATLNLVLTSAPTAGSHYTLISNQGGQAVSGTFAALAQGATVQAQFGGQTYKFSITYQGGSGHDVVLIALGPPVVLTTPVLGGNTSVNVGSPFQIDWTGGAANDSVQLWAYGPGGWQELTTGVAASAGDYSWNTAGNDHGWYYFTAWVTPASGATPYQIVSPDYVDLVNSAVTQPPTVTLLNPPLSTDSVAQGTSYTINWNTTEQAGDTNPLDVQLWVFGNISGLVGASSTWSVLPNANSIIQTGSSGSYVWDTTNVAPGWYSFSAHVTDGDKWGAGDPSPGWVQVTLPTLPTFTYLTPTNGQTGAVGTPFALNWSMSGVSAGDIANTTVQIWAQYLDDQGDPVWTQIAASVNAAAGTFSWNTTALTPHYYAFNVYVGYGDVWIGEHSPYWVQLM